MSRMRSPSYPSISLDQAIDLVGKLHSRNRTNIIDRASAAKDMGYSGLTGRSLTLLGALAQFNLIAKAGKGDIRVTPTAVDILHAIEPRDKARALQEAGHAPRLFKELYDRFPDGIPSENAIRSYLIQQGYGDVAIGPAIKSFLETNRYLENAGVIDSHGGDGADDAESPATSTPEAPMQPQPSVPPQAYMPVPPSAFATADRQLNKINMNIQGDQVHIDALLDYNGLIALEAKISALKMLMKVYTEAGDTGEPQ